MIWPWHSLMMRTLSGVEPSHTTLSRLNWKNMAGSWRICPLGNHWAFPKGSYEFWNWIFDFLIGGNSIERWLVPVKPVVIQRKASLMTKLRSCIPHQCSSKYLKNNYVFVVWIAGFLLTNLILFLTRAVCFSDRNQCATIWLVLAKSSG